MSSEWRGKHRKNRLSFAFELGDGRFSFGLGWLDESKMTAKKVAGREERGSNLMLCRVSFSNLRKTIFARIKSSNCYEWHKMAG